MGSARYNLVFDERIAAELVDRIPPNKPIHAMAVGKEGDWATAEQYLLFLQNRGFKIQGFDRTYTAIPEPEYPISIFDNPTVVNLIIAPRAHIDVQAVSRGTLFWPSLPVRCLPLWCWYGFSADGFALATVRMRDVINNEWWLILSGLISIAFGVVLLAWPGTGALALIWTIAWYAVFFGCMLVGVSFELKKQKRF